MIEGTELYQQTIMERGRNPRHRHRLPQANVSAHDSNPMCGDAIDLDLRFAENGAVSEAGYTAQGCTISIASADLMADLAAGRGAAQLRKLFQRFQTMLSSGTCPDDDEELAELRAFSSMHAYPSRIGCATLPWRALMAALDLRRMAT